MNNDTKSTEEIIASILVPFQAVFGNLDKHMGNTNNTLTEYLEVMRMHTMEIKKNNLLIITQNPTFSTEERIAARQEYDNIMAVEKERQTLPHSIG